MLLDPACLDKDADGLVFYVPLTPEVTNIDQKPSMTPKAAKLT